MPRASALLFIAIIASPALADPATTVREVRLMAEPFDDATVIATLSAGTTIETIGREGGWYEVNATDNRKGWLHMLGIGFGGNGQGAKGDGVASLFNLMRGGTGGQTVATGIRGLDSEDIRNASPDTAALAALDEYAAPVTSAQRFAAQGGLKATRVEHLAQPPDEETPSGE